MTSEEIFVADAWETGGNLAGRVYFGKDKNSMYDRRSRSHLLQRAAGLAIEFCTR